MSPVYKAEACQCLSLSISAPALCLSTLPHCLMQSYDVWHAECWPVIAKGKPNAGSGVVRIDPLCFVAGCHTRRLNHVFRVSYLSILYIVLLFLGPFLCIVSFHCYVFCLVVVLVELSVFAKWLTRKTPLRKPNHGEESSPESPGRRVHMIFLVYCIVSLFYYVSVLSPGPTWYIFLLLWHDVACLCWKCR